MRFQKGNKLGKGGRKDPPGGRPTKEQAEQKRLEAETARAIIEKNAKKLAVRYVSRALANKADKVLMHAIDKLVSHAKQEIEHSGLIVHELKTNVPDESDPF